MASIKWTYSVDVSYNFYQKKKYIVSVYDLFGNLISSTSLVLSSSYIGVHIGEQISIHFSLPLSDYIYLANHVFSKPSLLSDTNSTYSLYYTLPTFYDSKFDYENKIFNGINIGSFVTDLSNDIFDGFFNGVILRYCFEFENAVIAVTSADSTALFNYNQLESLTAGSTYFYKKIPKDTRENTTCCILALCYPTQYNLI